jgi:hypothetical protein
MSRYRLEVIDGELAVRHVQTYRTMATVRRHFRISPRGSTPPILDTWTVEYPGGQKLGPYDAMRDPNPVERALDRAGSLGGEWPDFDPPAKPQASHLIQEIEFRLGEVLADAAALLARGLIEYRSGGMQAETKEKFSHLIGQLYLIWYSSQFGSFNAERRAHEPYFENRPPQHPRMDFAEAAQRLGMEELWYRFPDAPEPFSKELLTCVLDFFWDALKQVSPVKGAI